MQPARAPPAGASDLRPPSTQQPTAARRPGPGPARRVRAAAQAAAAAAPQFSPLALHALQLEGADNRHEEVSQQLLSSYAADDGSRRAPASAAHSASSSSYEDALSTSPGSGEAWPQAPAALRWQQQQQQQQQQQPGAPGSAAAGWLLHAGAAAGERAQLLQLAAEYNSALQEAEEGEGGEGRGLRAGAAAGPRASLDQDLDLGLDLEEVSQMHIGGEQADAGQQEPGGGQGAGAPAGVAAAHVEAEGRRAPPGRPTTVAGALARQLQRLLALLLLQLLPGALRLLGRGLQATGLGRLLAPPLHGAASSLARLLARLLRALARVLSWMMWPLGLALSYWYARWAQLSRGDGRGGGPGAAPAAAAAAAASEHSWRTGAHTIMRPGPPPPAVGTCPALQHGPPACRRSLRICFPVYAPGGAPGALLQPAGPACPHTVGTWLLASRLALFVPAPLPAACPAWARPPRRNRAAKARTAALLRAEFGREQLQALLGQVPSWLEAPTDTGEWAPRRCCLGVCGVVLHRLCRAHQPRAFLLSFQA
jgi:hypothetical protein